MIDEILNTLKKHKILFVVTLVACLLCAGLNVFAAEGDSSSFVTTSDGKSYPGLPAFPTSNFHDGSQDDWYTKNKNYILFCDSETSVYYLLCTPSDTVYLNGTNILSSGVFCSYYNSACTSVMYDKNSGSQFTMYKLDGASWVFKSHYSSTLTLDSCGDLIVQSSCNIYSDSSCTEVFTQSATESLIVGLSSTKIVESLKMEMVGLVPLVIGFLTLVWGLLKAWKMLRQVLVAQ